MFDYIYPQLSFAGFSCYDREKEVIGLNNHISTGYIDDIYKKICIEEETDDER